MINGFFCCCHSGYKENIKNLKIYSNNNNNKNNKIKLILILILSIYIKDCNGQVRPELPRNRPPPITTLACSLNSCSEQGEPCSFNLSSGSSGFTCYVEDRCQNGTCVPSLQQGEVCIDSDECNLGYSCVTELSNLSFTQPNKTKTCEPSFFSEYGGLCRRATDCLNSLDCINNTCSTPVYGCLSDLSCDRNSICVNATCVFRPLGENECYMSRSFDCKNTYNPCALSSLNVSSIGVCLDYIPLGNPCLTTKYSCDWRTGQVCRPLFLGSVVGRCVVVQDDPIISCVTASNCRPYEFCKCDSQSGVGYCVKRTFFAGKYCRQAFMLFLDCYRSTNCTQPFSFNPTSCILRSHCKDLAICVASFCTEPLLPISLCVNRICELSIFNDSSVRTILSSSFNDHIIKPLKYFKIILLFLFLLSLIIL
ncbi:hypothetical protein ACTFIY_001875 [Dictyostelium cf. discoideum]